MGEMLNNIKEYNTCIIGVTRGEEEEQSNKTFKMILNKEFLKFY